jgi:hypothetical protein
MTTPKRRTTQRETIGRRRWESVVPSALAILLALSLFACEESSQTPEEVSTSEEPNAITQEKERGPLKVTLRLEPKNPTFAERIRYTITSHAARGVDVTMPSPGENLGHFIIKDFESPPARENNDGTMEWQQVYVLEVVTSGEYVIPETRVAFVDRRDELAEKDNTAGQPPPSDTPPDPTGDPDTEPGSEPIIDPDASDTANTVYKLVTDPIKFQVASLENPESLQDLRPIAAPVEPPVIPAKLRWPLIIGGSIVGITALGVILFLIFRKREKKLPPPIPPEEIAYQELEWLLAQGFTERDELKEFYFHLSRIVREYIERRFGLRAPERTTEEFLEDLRHSDLLGSSHKTLLVNFLEKADLVKFARYAPGTDEVTTSFDAAKDFIAQTRPQAEEVASGSR